MIIRNSTIMTSRLGLHNMGKHAQFVSIYFINFIFWGKNDDHYLCSPNRKQTGKIKATYYIKTGIRVTAALRRNQNKDELEKTS